jgi:hypothetical protein
MTIETPTRVLPPTGPPVVPPPPDPRTREPDPPPDPGSCYELGCAECGTPLRADQAACLNCGAMVRHDEGGAGIRRAALGSVTALLVLGGAVGAAVAGLPHGKNVPKPTIAKVFGAKTPPPATAGTNGSGTSPTTPLPGAGTTAKPPPIAPVKPSTSKTKKNPKTTSANNSNSSSGSNNTGGSNGQKKKKSKKKTDQGTHTKHHHKSLGLFASGVAPASAEVFTASGSHSSSSADHTIDSDVNSLLAATHTETGIIVEPASPPYVGIGIVSSTPGYAAKVYYSNESSPPGDLTSTAWHQVGSTSSGAGHERFSIPPAGKNADHYLVWITGLPSKGTVKINEIQLFQ